MRTRIAFAVFILVATIAALAQERPNLSGVWIEDGENPLIAAMGLHSNPDIQTELVIKQTGDVVSSTLISRSKKTSSVIGKPSSQSIHVDGIARTDPNSQFSKTETVRKNYWDGNVLVIAVTESRDGRVINESQRRWWIDDHGRLVVEAITRRPDGREARMRSTHHRKRQ